MDYHAALDIRLSKENESEEPSQSVQNQEFLLREFVQQPTSIALISSG